ncbi:MAG: hypothetical protein ACXAD7_05560, partial [Candidatus Kariarchaeaceae archaeon]
IASRIFITGLPKELVVFPENMDQTLVEYFTIEGDAGEKIVKSAIHVLERAKDDDKIFPSGSTHGVYLSADIPAISEGAILRFLQACGDRSASFYYSMVHRKHMDDRFPNNGRSYTNIDGEKYCGADMNLSELSMAEPSYPLLKSILANRKSFIKALFWASPLTFFKFIFHRVGLKDAERLMTKIFKLEARLIVSEDPEIAFDVDKPFQLDLMRKHFTKSSIGSI